MPAFPPSAVCSCSPVFPAEPPPPEKISLPLQAEKLRNRLQDLENLLARFDCRSRSGRHLPNPRRPAAEQQREESLPNALEDFLAFQGTQTGLNPPCLSHTPPAPGGHPKRPETGDEM